MESLSEEQKIKERHRQANEGRKKALRREKYLSGFAVLIIIICLAITAAVLSLIILGVIEAIHYLWRPEIYSGLF